MSHQKTQHLTTSKVLELLHMDLMGPMQVEIIGGKKYAYVVVNEFYIYTCVVTKKFPSHFTQDMLIEVLNCSRLTKNWSDKFSF